MSSRRDGIIRTSFERDGTLYVIDQSRRLSRLPEVRPRTGFESRKKAVTGGIDLDEFGALADMNSSKQAQARRTADRAVACVFVRCDDVFSVKRHG
jgi:hypothetical protein